MTNYEDYLYHVKIMFKENIRRNTNPIEMNRLKDEHIDRLEALSECLIKEQAKILEELQFLKSVAIEISRQIKYLDQYFGIPITPFCESSSLKEDI